MSRIVARIDATAEPRSAFPTDSVADPRNANRAITILAICTALAMSPSFVTSAILDGLRNEHGLSVSATAWLAISAQLGFVIGGLALAITGVADRFSLHRLIALFAAIAALFNLALVEAGPLSTMLLRGLMGAALAGVYPPGMKLAVTWFRDRRGFAIAIMVGALTLATAAPHLVRAIGSFEWRTVVVVCSALGLLGALIAGLVLREGPYPFPRAPFDLTAAPKVFTERPLRLVSMGYFGHMWELFAMWVWFGPFFADQLGATVSRPTGPLVTFTVIGIGAVGAWWGGWLSERRGSEYATIASMWGSVTCAAITAALADRAHPAIIATVGLVWGWTVIADSAQFSAIVTEVADQRYVGTALTMQTSLGFTLTVSTIWMMPLIRDAVGWGAAFAILIPGPLLGIWAMERLRALRAATG